MAIVSSGTRVAADDYDVIGRDFAFAFDAPMPYTKTLPSGLHTAMGTAMKRCRQAAVFTLSVSLASCQTRTTSAAASPTQTLPALLSLTPINTLALPVGVRVSGALELIDRLLIWNSSSVWLRIQSRKEFSEVCPSRMRNIDVVFWAPHDSSIGIADLHHGSIYKMDLDGRHCSLWFNTGKLDGDPLDAAWAASSLYILSLDASHLLLSRFDTTGVLAGTFSFQPPTMSELALRWCYVRSQDDLLVLGTHRYGSWWTVLRTDGSTRLQSSGLVFETTGHTTDNAARFETYVGQALRLGNVYVQSVTDLTTQNRFIALYDTLGHFLRISPKPVEASLLAVSPSGDQAVGLKRIPVPSLIVYSRGR